MKAIIAALGGGAATDKIWADGVHVTGEKYVVTKAEDRSIYGRKVIFIIPTLPSYLQPAAFRTKSQDTNTLIPLGQGGHCHLQNYASYPRRPLR
jgi:Profilin